MMAMVFILAEWANVNNNISKETDLIKFVQ